MSHHITKYTQPGAMVLDLFLGTGATATGRLLLAKHVGCDSDSYCVSKMRPSLLQVISEQGLSSESDMSESEKVQDSAMRHVKLSAAEGETERKLSWKTPKGVLLVQLFPDHKTFFIYPDITWIWSY